MEPDDLTSVGLKSPVLNRIISSLPRLKEPVKELLDVVNLKNAAEGNKATMWNDPERYPGIIDSDIVTSPIHFRGSVSLNMAPGSTSYRNGADG